MMLFSIFMASRITTSCPLATVSPGATSTFKIRPGIGEVTTLPVIGAAAGLAGSAFGASAAGAAAGLGASSFGFDA